MGDLEECGGLLRGRRIVPWHPPPLPAPWTMYKLGQHYVAYTGTLVSTDNIDTFNTLAKQINEGTIAPLDVGARNSSAEFQLGVLQRSRDNLQGRLKDLLYAWRSENYLNLAAFFNEVEEELK